MNGETKMEDDGNGETMETVIWKWERMEMGRRWIRGDDGRGGATTAIC